VKAPVPGQVQRGLSTPVLHRHWLLRARRQRPPGRAAEQRDEGAAAPSFNHLVGAREQRSRHIEAERLGGFQVDH
jgi:hypothetical protein